MKNYFPRLIGNEETKIRIGRAIDSQTIPHAFLIGGPSGSGKSTLATELAAAMNCENRNADRLPCGGCNNCRRIYEGNFPDVKILKKPKDKATLGVEPVKLFREDMFLSSTESEYKIYIIDDAEAMTSEAQNALLKVLEEPPKSVMILLLAKECDRILTTIKSRAQYVAMSRFDEDSLSEQLLRESAEARAIKMSDEARFRSLVMSADGRLGLAKKLVTKKDSEETEAERNEIIRLIRSASGRASYADIYTALSALSNKRSEFIEALEKLINALRDLILLKNDEKAKLIFFTSPEEAKECGSFSQNKLLSLYDAANRAHSLCIRNAYVPNVIANLSAEIKQAVNK